MVSCFPEDCFPEENLFMVCFFPKSNPINEKCDIHLIKDISNIILSYLYVCPGCGCPVIHRECKPTFDETYVRSQLRYVRSNIQLECKFCWDDWKRRHCFSRVEQCFCNFFYGIYDIFYGIFHPS